MGDTAIDYCDKTWDVTFGCKERSEGCRNCWALPSLARIAGRFPGGPAAKVISRDSHGALRWSGEVELLESNLDLPRHWRGPQLIFVNSKSDLFDERVPLEYIARVFDTMATCPEQRFMVLTKCVERMAEFVEWYQHRLPIPGAWPGAFRHVILMVSVESPKHLDRIETLLSIPAAMRGVSFEPLIEPVGNGLLKYLADVQCSNCGWLGFRDNDTPEGGLAKEYDGPDDVDGHWECPNCGASEDGCVHDYSAVHNPFGPDPRLDWVVIGCEKLPGGRPGRWAAEDPGGWWAAAAEIVEQCQNAGIAVWMKQGPTSDWRRVTHDVLDFPDSCRVQEKPKGLLL